MQKHMSQQVKDIIENVLKSGLFSYDEVVMHEPELDQMFWYQIKSPDSKALIGMHGETLSALNHVVKKIAERGRGESEEALDFYIDVNDYQKKRVDNLKTIAHMMAERARFFKSSVDVDPMSAFDRKIIHAYLASHTDIKTESEGNGPTRHIVIRFVDTKKDL